MSNAMRWNEEQLREYERKQELRRRQGAGESQGRLSPAEERIRVHEQEKAVLGKRQSKLEQRFEQQLLERPEIPPHLRNYFFLADRNFELDFAWPAHKVAVEIQGMAHRVKGRFKADIEKRALAMLADWRVLEVDGDSVRNGRGIEWLTTLLGRVT